MARDQLSTTNFSAPESILFVVIILTLGRCPMSATTIAITSQLLGPIFGPLCLLSTGSVLLLSKTSKDRPKILLKRYM
jgi:hypothetical protein